MQLHILFVVLLSSALAQAQVSSPATQSTPAAAAPAPSISREQILTNARKVTVVGAVGVVADLGIALNPSAQKAQKSIEKEIRSWGRFKLIGDPSQADLLLVLFEGNRAAGGGGTIRTARLVVFPGGPLPKRGDLPLWEGEASGSIFMTSGAPKVIRSFRAYLESLDKRAPAVEATPAGSTAPVAVPGIVAGETKQPAATETASTAKAVAPAPVSAALTPRATQYIPPFEVIGKAKTYTLRGRGTAGKQEAFDKILGVGKYSDVQSAMSEIYEQMRTWGRMQYVDEVSKADLVVVVFQWDTRTYSRQFHGVQSAIWIAEGGEAFQRDDPALWASGTVDGSTRGLIAGLRFELDQFSQAQQLQATQDANKFYKHGCDLMDSAEKKKYKSDRNQVRFEAIAELRKSVRDSYGYAPAHERLGAVLRQLGFDTDSVYEYKLALQLQPGMPEALKGMVRALAMIPDYDEGLRAAQELIHAEPGKSDSYVILGDLQYAKKDYAAAASAYEEAIRIDPNSEIAHEKLGRALYRDKKMDKAEAAIREALRLNPNNQNAMTWLGSTLNEEHKPEEAVSVLRKAEESYPKDSSIHFEMARALRALQQFDDSLKELRLALTLDPTAVTYHVELAHTLASAGKHEEALAKCREIVLNLPNSPSAHVDLGIELLAMSKTDDAVKEFEQAIKLDEKYARAYFYLGRARAAKGDAAGAQIAYDKARSLDPQNEEFQKPNR